MQKQGYHLDEIYSYGLANSNYKPFLDSHNSKDSAPAYITNDYYSDYVSATETTKFDFKSVIDNQKHDVHPPLYYILLHIVCSLFTGSFNKWFGLILNIVFFTITLTTIFATTRRLTQSKLIPIACILLYGLSTGAILTTTYIRMYMMLTMFVSLYIYLHVKMITTERQRLGDLISLSIVTFFGFLTQYYFIIFAMLMSGLYVSLLLLTKKAKSIGQYAIAIAIPLLIILIIYPYAYTTILGTNSEVDGFNHAQYASSGGGNLFGPSLAEFAYFLNRELFSCLLKPIIIFMLGVVIAGILRRFYKVIFLGKGILIERRNYKSPRKIFLSTKFIAICIILVSACLYLMVVAKISYLKSDRYIFCIYPAISMTFVLAIYKLFRHSIIGNRILTYLLTFVLIIIILIAQYVRYCPNGEFPDTLYLSDRSVNDYMTENQNTTCFYIYNNSNEWAETQLLPWLKQCGGGIYKIANNDLDKYIDNNDIMLNSSYTLFVDTEQQLDQDVPEIIQLISNDIGNNYKETLIAEINPENHWSIPTSIQVYNLSLE